MINFKKAKFKSIIEYKSGYTWTKEQELRQPEIDSVRVLTVTNVQKKLDLSSELYLHSVSEKDKQQKAVSKDWSIAVSSNGNRKRIGNAVFIDDNTEYLFASFLTAFKPKIDSDILPIYFFYWFSSHLIQERISAVSEGTTGLGNLDIRFLRNMEIEYPENPKEQTAIAAVLSKVDEAIAAVERSVKSAERLKKALMQNLLTGKLKPNGEWRGADEFQQTKIGLLPKDWTVKTVKEISTLVTDGEHLTPERSESGYYLLSARNIKNGYLALDDVDFVEEKELRRMQKRCNPQTGDILISCSGTIGNVCIVPEGLDAGMVRSAALVKLDRDLIEPEFAELVFQSFSLQNQMKVSVASSVQGNIFQGAIKKLRIPYPSKSQERMEIANKINGLSANAKTKQTKIQTLQRLKKSLMQNLLTGKVRVNVEKIERLLTETND